jgi:hypothetical protein
LQVAKNPVFGNVVAKGDMGLYEGIIAGLPERVGQ